jgi:hypothetical protein
MSEESKKVEKTEQETEQQVKTPEMLEQDLDNIAGGAATAGFLKASSRVTSD